MLHRSIAANHDRLVQETNTLQLGLLHLKTDFELLGEPERTLRSFANLQTLDLRILGLDSCFR